MAISIFIGKGFLASELKVVDVIAVWTSCATLLRQPSYDDLFTFPAKCTFVVVCRCFTFYYWQKLGADQP